MYASVTIVFDFLFQISFFVALLVLDERRIAGTLFANENGDHPGFIQYFCCCCRCCCSCCGADSPSLGDSSRTYRNSSAELSRIHRDMEQMQRDMEDEEFFMDRLMRWYAKQLLRPVMKAIVIAIFLVCLGLNIYSTTKLEQQFNIEGKTFGDRHQGITFLRSRVCTLSGAKTTSHQTVTPGHSCRHSMITPISWFQWQPISATSTNRTQQFNDK